MKRYNVLVTGTSSYGVGEGLLKVISRSQYRNMIKLVGASNSILTRFRNLTDSYQVLPSAREKNYLECLQNVLADEKIDILIPGSEAEMELLSTERCKLDVDVWVNNYEIINLFNDKLNTYHYFKKHNFKTPKVFLQEEELCFPLIIKPVTGKSSEGIFRVNNLTQFKAVEELNKAYNNPYIVQEFIEGGEEYTVSMISSGSSADSLIMKRILNKGATQYAMVKENMNIAGIINELHDLLKDYLILNVQLICKDEGIYIFEVNPRFSGSAPMRALLGFNEFDIIFTQKYLGGRLGYKIDKSKYVIRGYTEHLYPMIQSDK